MFSSYLTKEAKIKYPNGQEDNDLNLDPQKVMGIIMQQCLEPHPNHSKLEPSGIKSIFRLKDLARNKSAHSKTFLLNLHILWDASNIYFFHIFILNYMCIDLIYLKCCVEMLVISIIYDRKVPLYYKWKWKTYIVQGFTLVTKPTKASSIMVVCFALDSQGP